LSDLALDRLADLATMPAFLEQVASRVTAETAVVPDEGGAFSLVEHAWHLADLEREGFGERIRRLQTEAAPHLADFDGARLARERAYRERSLPEAVETFARARFDNIAALHGLREEDWAREGSQEQVGPVTLADVPRMMAEHDAAHRGEIELLLKRIAP
jgi:hypothetical protein